MLQHCPTRKRVLLLILFFALSFITMFHKMSKVNFFLPSPQPRISNKTRSTEKTEGDILQALLKYVPQVNYKEFDQTSNAKKSRATLLHPKQNYTIGETIRIQVDICDHNGNLKTYGGDFILARIRSPEHKAAASGVVKDLNNGIYHIDFKLFWPGQVEVVVQLVHPSEAVAAIWRAKQMDYDKISYTGIFTNNSVQEKTECYSYLKSSQSVCLYVDEREKETYSCLKPLTLSCETLTFFQSRNSITSYLTKNEIKLLDRSNIAVTIPNDFPTISVFSINNELLLSSEKCYLGTLQPVPSGFFHSGHWYPSFCNCRSFQNDNDINSCLQGKDLYFRGDSTVRQWLEHLTSKLKNLKYLKTTEKFKSRAPMLAVDEQRNITIDWRKHGHPWITVHLNVIKEGNYVSREVDKIAGGENIIVVITVGQHFRPFPLELHIRRLLNIRKAIERLKARSPKTRVFIKLENIRELTSETLRFSNWHGYIQNLAQREVFHGLNVTFLDAWDMTVADNTNNVHPPQHVVHSQVALFLSYLCHNSSD
ncbi:NXPE family member 2-like [Erpetoichthys calabaricus]|uniref:NXPE family member 2-like n=1 Tax=Erpetoichthys calabaricus TaxID=27687 RepID=UPI00109FB352|nr:NXPE family member 2-like [Erpetoichthys calabaricus]